MKQIWQVVKREYFSRVKKKTFIIMTLLVPILFVLLYAVIIGLAINQRTGESTVNVCIVDSSQQLKPYIINANKMDFTIVNSKNDIPKETFAKVMVPSKLNLYGNQNILVMCEKNLSIEQSSKIKTTIGNAIKSYKLEKFNLRKTFLDSLDAKITLNEIKIEKNGELKTSKGGFMLGLGMGMASLIYFFIFIYGVQVMRGVMEEKSNRIVEIIISSVKPFQLMMGKILGIAMVGLTQMLIWIVFGGILMIIGSFFLMGSIDVSNIQELAANQTHNANLQDMSWLQAIINTNWLYYFGMFVFYFIGGYLLYSSLFAAVGAAVDSETDTQQFMLPITLPLVISFATSISIITNAPNGTLAKFMSIFPLTSPVVMMLRLPFEPEIGEILLSMLLLILGFFGTVWLGSRIYRIGILMYGKKPTYKELSKWIFRKY